MVSDSAATVEVTVEAARDAVLALTELRGWAGAGSRREREFMLPRIDRCIDAFGIGDIVRDIHHDVIEGVEPDAR